MPVRRAGLGRGSPRIERRRRIGDADAFGADEPDPGRRSQDPAGALSPAGARPRVRASRSTRARRQWQPPPRMPDLPLVTLVAAALAVTLAYTVFGLTGFGAAIVGVPLLAHVVPIRLRGADDARLRPLRRPSARASGTAATSTAASCCASRPSSPSAWSLGVTGAGARTRALAARRARRVRLRLRVLEPRSAAPRRGPISAPLGRCRRAWPAASSLPSTAAAGRSTPSTSRAGSATRTGCARRSPCSSSAPRGRRLAPLLRHRSDVPAVAAQRSRSCSCPAPSSATSSAATCIGACRRAGGARDLDPAAGERCVAGLARRGAA